MILIIIVGNKDRFNWLCFPFKLSPNRKKGWRIFWLFFRDTNCQQFKISLGENESSFRINLRVGNNQKIDTKNYCHENWVHYGAVNLEFLFVNRKQLLQFVSMKTYMHWGIWIKTTKLNAVSLLQPHLCLYLTLWFFLL